MLVVSNTSPILNLAIVDQLSLLRQQFGRIQIPSAVLDELKMDEERPGSQRIRIAITQGWIQVQSVSDVSLIRLLRQTLDKGESEAIALALEIQAQWTILDEHDGRKIAKSLGLQVTGILGILIRAKQTGELSSLETIMDQLIKEAGFRIASDLLAKVLTV
ncbi:DUF3368 domain-containing protein [Gloeocapsa sp. PCC 73106]|uniref:DUF3368 domain-containing protein n=1 Tax=Gloeocapsa sp. PCC 73106 TaxID=102232 RepID=UPI0002ABFF57|nr:DUF3368 domain-containing protein [Gloeocapsa sp. PCC 73106]ELR97534.1 putative nucleic acid-binding protein [Gloeocapsa sp. PCC 73106]